MSQAVENRAAKAAQANGASAKTTRSGPVVATPERLAVFPQGTDVVETDSKGNPLPNGRTFKSLGWISRVRPQGSSEGCPQWIDIITLGDTLTTAQTARNLIGPDNAIASSSISSRDVLAIHVDASGQRDQAFTVPYVLVPELSNQRSPDGLPVAKTIWFSQEPFAPEVTNATKCID